MNNDNSQNGDGRWRIDYGSKHPSGSVASERILAVINSPHKDGVFVLLLLLRLRIKFMAVRPMMLGIARHMGREVV